MAENKRLCSRTMCRREADWTLTYAYADSTAVIGPLAPRVEPHAYDLCAVHADRLTAPRGWEVVRVGQDVAAPAPGDPGAAVEAEATRPARDAQSPDAGDARPRLRGLPTRR